VSGGPIDAIAWQTVHDVAEAMGDPSHHDTPLAAFARRAGYEATHFAKLFREVIGEPPIRFARRRRLHAAALALEQTDQSVLEVAQSIGYASHEAFARAFRRQFGLSPTAFRDHPAMNSPRGPARCPDELRWTDAAVVRRGFVGVSRVVDPLPRLLDEAIAALAAAYGPLGADALGGAADPWGWRPAEDPPRFRVVALTEQPSRPPWPPLRIRDRDWLRTTWTGAPHEVSAAIFWIYERGLAQRGRTAGFAPTLTLGHLGGPTTIWVPLRPRLTGTGR